MYNRPCGRSFDKWVFYGDLKRTVKKLTQAPHHGSNGLCYIFHYSSCSVKEHLVKKGLVQLAVRFLHASFVGFTHVQTPQFARGNVFASHPTQQQLQEQDKYKAYLKQQVQL